MTRGVDAVSALISVRGQVRPVALQELRGRACLLQHRRAARRQRRIPVSCEGGGSEKGGAETHLARRRPFHEGGDGFEVFHGRREVLGLGCKSYCWSLVTEEWLGWVKRAEVARMPDAGQLDAPTEALQSLHALMFGVRP
jgi:hypothetical protein